MKIKIKQYRVESKVQGAELDFLGAAIKCSEEPILKMQKLCSGGGGGILTRDCNRKGKLPKIRGYLLLRKWIGLLLEQGN